MTIVEISIDRGQLPEHTDEQFEEWLELRTGMGSGMSPGNPLHGRPLTADRLIDWRDDCTQADAAGAAS